MKYFLIALVVLVAALLGFFGVGVIRRETTLDGKVLGSAGMMFFVLGLLYLAYLLYASPL